MENCRGWIGTYLNEMEDRAESFEEPCAKLVNEIIDYKKTDSYKAIANMSKEAISATYGDELTTFISKYSLAAGGAFEAMGSKVFAVLGTAIQDGGIGTPLDAYKSAHDEVTAHSKILEANFTQLGLMNSKNEYTSAVYKIKSKEKLMASISYSQKELKKSLEALDSSIEGVKIESTDKDDCALRGVEQYTESLKMNSEALLKIKIN